MTEEKKVYILMSLSLAFLAVSQIFDAFSFLVFLSLSPLFFIFENFREINNGAWHKGLIKVALVLIVGFTLWNLATPNLGFYHWMLAPLYGLGMSLSFLLFIFSDRYARNRLGFFTILIYWLALEYLFITLYPEFARYLLGAVFDGDKYLISWNLHTGLMGVSLWILVVNILFYYALLKDNSVFKGKIRMVSIAYMLLAICIPFIIDTSAEAIFSNDIIEGVAAQKQITGNGEYVGKTAVWISILMLSYSFVKRKIRK